MADTGLEKSAALLVSLGEEVASEILRHLPPREVQKLGAAMASIQSIPRARIEEILDEFLDIAVEHGALYIDPDNFVRSVLTKALGDNAASSMLNRILSASDTSGIEGLRWMAPSTVADVVQNEHPQIIASILVHLDQEQASAVLNRFSEHLRNEVVLRIATLDGIQPKALQELNDVMLDVVANAHDASKSAVGGVRAAANILNVIGHTNEASILESVREYDPDLAQKIQDEMFVFEDVISIDERSVQDLLQEVPKKSLVLALKGTSDDLRDKIFRNMSQRAGEMLRDDLDSLGPVRLSEVEAAQQEILRIIRRMVDEGKIAQGGEALL